MMGKKMYTSHKSVVFTNPERIKIGDGTFIWHFSHIMRDATIGANCTIGQNCFIGESVTIGNNCKIQNNVSIYNGVVLEDDVFIGPSVVFTNVLLPRATVAQKDDYKLTRVKRGATVGANSTIIAGVVIGQYSTVGAGAVVTRSTPPNSLVYGSPARLQGWVCDCGKKLVQQSELMFKCRCGKKFNEFPAHPHHDRTLVDVSMPEGL